MQRLGVYHSNLAIGSSTLHTGGVLTNIDLGFREPTSFLPLTMDIFEVSMSPLRIPPM